MFQAAARSLNPLCASSAGVQGVSEDFGRQETGRQAGAGHQIAIRSPCSRQWSQYTACRFSTHLHFAVDMLHQITLDTVNCRCGHVQSQFLLCSAARVPRSATVGCDLNTDHQAQCRPYAMASHKVKLACSTGVCWPCSPPSLHSPARCLASGTRCISCAAQDMACKHSGSCQQGWAAADQGSLRACQRMQVESCSPLMRCDVRRLGHASKVDSGLHRYKRQTESCNYGAVT